MQTAHSSLLAKLEWASFATTVQLPREAGVKLLAIWRLALPGVIGDDRVIVQTWSLLGLLSFSLQMENPEIE